MGFALDGEQAVVACCHGSETVPDEIWFWVVVGIPKNMRYRHGVCCHQATSADEATVYEGGAVLGLPVGDEVVVLLVVHLHEVSHEEGRGRGPWEVAERRDGLADEEADEGRESI